MMVVSLVISLEKNQGVLESKGGKLANINLVGSAKARLGREKAGLDFCLGIKNQRFLAGN